MCRCIVTRGAAGLLGGGQHGSADVAQGCHGADEGVMDVFFDQLPPAFNRYWLEVVAGSAQGLEEQAHVQRFGFDDVIDAWPVGPGSSVV